MIVRRRFEFQAAHCLPDHAGKCRNVHGHSYRLDVSVERPVDAKSGMAIEFADVKAVVLERVVLPLDHSLLNDTVENPTTERMCLWIWRRLIDGLPGLTEIELHETEKCSVVYRGD